MDALRFKARLDREKSTASYSIFRAVEEVEGRSLASVYVYRPALEGEPPEEIEVQIAVPPHPPHAHAAAAPS